MEPIIRWWVFPGLMQPPTAPGWAGSCRLKGSGNMRPLAIRDMDYPWGQFRSEAQL